MIKALLRTNGQDGSPGPDILILGLSHENVKRLTAKQPIVFNLREVGLDPCEVMIVVDEDEAKIQAELEKRFGPPAHTTVDPIRGKFDTGVQ